MTFDHTQLKNLNVIKIWGKVTRIVGLVIEGHCPHASIGSLCELTTIDGNQKIYAEIVGFKDGRLCSCLWENYADSDREVVSG